jgi:UDP-sulfoquinovose synthase
LGWATAMFLSRRGHKVAVLDNFAKRRWELELNVEPLIPIRTLHDRVHAWKSLTGRDIELFVGDLRNYGVVEGVLQSFRPEAIVHYGEQPSAPYSMIDHNRSVFTEVNNVTGTLNVLWAMKKLSLPCHLVKLGTMGEYGTPNIDIEEGFIEIEHKGRRDILPFPCQPGSFYHLSKVHDSHNIRFACRAWRLAATDLHQGVVYGIETAETVMDERLATSFHYDDVFGTAINRFCVQAAAGIPLTVYGKGGQRRGFLNIRDTVRCVELAVLNPAKAGEYRVFNQFTETFTVLELANLVADQAHKLGLTAEVSHIENPRVELEEHHYNPVHTKLLDLGLEPHFLSQELVGSMIGTILKYKDRIKPEIVLPKVKWNAAADEIEELKLMWAGA